ncbi:MAG: hypothetical protein JWO71_2478 [Candidatus Acidoferrum typicum]|nr:hypothetical protein [Candidatus Acidoferrum typicum]
MTWFETRGFGFIHSIVDGEVRSYFAHISQFHGQPRVGATVLFNAAAGKGSKGPVARNVEVVTEIQKGVAALAAGEVRS